MVGEEWYSTIIEPFLRQLGAFIPQLVLAVVVFVIGYFIAVGIGRLVTEILKGLKFNRLFAKEGWQKAFEKADIKVDPSAFIGAIFKWVFVIVSLLITVDILNLVKFGELLRDILNYIPNVIIAVLIFVVGVIIADIVEKLVRATVEKMKVSYASLAAAIVRWTIWVFLVFMILDQLLPKSDLVQVLYKGIVYGIVAAVAGSIAIAFGLGGKDAAAGAIEDLKRKIKQ
ncbi:hypothetical protein KKE19_00335 [Patescibacteria group bacterium]|nr:hypothetical protein [Patescibacteria group bacterium]MBU4367647.1 hypothetical protein [Patescibacteria group bacterium]MBU4462127.1 hypothetical protein [Patescibacteria group bacterium]MCG2700446.1 hypothetical protein [Candidatus Parcubacteria bacterium]